MKRIFKYIVICAAFCITSCADLDQFPEDRLVPENYFGSEAELRQYTNSFYSLEPQVGNFKWFMEQSELMIPEQPSNEIKGARALPSKGSDVGWSWGTLRDINYYLQYSHRCKDVNIRNKYDGIAYFFRALFYYNMLVKFGEVPWYDEPIGSADETMLRKPRDSRETVIRNIIRDCDRSYELLSSVSKERKVTEVCAWTALALKSRATLFEGTFRKYHAGDPFNPQSLPWEELLQICADCSRKLMNEGGYSLSNTGAESYRNMFANIVPDQNEYIWARIYGDQVGGKHNANDNSKTRRTSMSKRFIMLFLNANGTRFTDREGWETMGYIDECQGRDPRLAQILFTPGYIQQGATKIAPMNIKNTRGAYQYVKYVMSDLYDAYNQSRASMPIFRLAEIYLNYAEALAELGTLNQTDLDNSINKLRGRVGMPNMDMNAANANPDQYLMSKEWGYPNVTRSANTGIILEIRRERLIELSLELVHFSDILRWKEGKVYECPWYGIYFPGAGKYDLTGDGKANVCLYTGAKPGGLGLTFLEIGKDIVLSEGDKGYAVSYGDAANRRVWNENRDYLYGIPTSERIITNGALTQNPGWEDNLNF